MPSGVYIRGIAVVRQDGSGNFTTVADAVNSAPNNTNAGQGFFLIYVKAGVYEEYISIPQWKKYLMMVGDGINKTEITGDRSNAVGWTTFNTSVSESTCMLTSLLDYNL